MLIILRNAMLVVIFGAMSSVQYNHMAAPWQDLELAEAKYQVSSVPRGVTYGKVKSSYGVPSKSYGSGYIGQGYGIPKGVPLFRWDAIRPKGKGAHHGKHGHPGKGGHHHHPHHHHGKGVVYIIKPAYVKPAYVKPAYVKPAYVHPVSTAPISSGYGSSQGTTGGTTHSGYSVSSGVFSSTNTGQASAYGLTNKKPFTAFKPFKGKGSQTPLPVSEEKGVVGSPAIEEKPATGGELVTPAVVAPAPEIVAPPAEVVAPVAVIAPPAPEVVTAEEPLSAEVVDGAAEPLSAEEVEPVSGEVEAQVVDEPELVPEVVAPEVVAPEVVAPEVVAPEEVAPEVVAHPVDEPEIDVIEAIVEIVESATEIANAPDGEVESATEVGGKDQQGEGNEIKEGKEEEETKAGENGANSEEEGGNNNNSDER
ncbi:calphotin-like [Daphnia pulex]|uniref:calphotin-like n=1 Tax=Daphnia pulex TaxID=6669 RepID=UPI001EDD76FF|nr:calphotin-like [Daphnia pulex]